MGLRIRHQMELVRCSSISSSKFARGGDEEGLKGKAGQEPHCGVWVGEGKEENLTTLTLPHLTCEGVLLLKHSTLHGWGGKAG